MTAEEQTRIHEVFCPYVERIISTQTIVKGLTTGNGVEPRLRGLERRVDILTVVLILGLTLDKAWPYLASALFP